ncbi:MAG: hypothetical protein AB8B85_12335 [Paracoccaceae bacterium]
MVPLQQAIQTLQQVQEGKDVTDTDRSMASALEALLWSMLDQKKKLDEIESVLTGVQRVTERLKHELIAEHNADIDAVTANLRSILKTIQSIKRVS